MKFNEKLQKLRKEKGMSQENLADLLNISRQSVSKWESGSAYPEMDKLIVISELFGVTMDELIKDGEFSESEDFSQNDALFDSLRRRYEYKSKISILGMPLVHVNIGKRNQRAKGIIAVGNISTGVISIGIVSTGILSLGVISAGLLSIGSISLGLIASAGVISVGYFSLGALAIGVYAMGPLAIGAFSFGGLAISSHMSVGKIAYGKIAIGETVSGQHTIKVSNINNVFNEVNYTQVKQLVDSSFSGFFHSLSSFFIRIFH